MPLTRLERSAVSRHRDAEAHSSGARRRASTLAIPRVRSAHSTDRGNDMSRTDSSHTLHPDQPRAMARLEMVMPRLTDEQMVAILREGGVPEDEANRWVEREARLAHEVSASG